MCLRIAKQLLVKCFHRITCSRALQFCRNEAKVIIKWRKISLVLSPNELIVCTAMRFLQRISSPIEIYFRAKILACIWLSWNLEKRRRPGWTNRTMGSKYLWFKQFDKIFLDYYVSFLQKVRTFWEAHKIWKKIFLMVWTFTK